MIFDDELYKVVAEVRAAGGTPFVKSVPPAFAKATVLKRLRRVKKTNIFSRGNNELAIFVSDVNKIAKFGKPPRGRM